MIGDEFPLEVFFILVPRWKANLGHVDNSREKICSGGVLASVLCRPGVYPSPGIWKPASGPEPPAIPELASWLGSQPGGWVAGQPAWRGRPGRPSPASRPSPAGRPEPRKPPPEKAGRKICEKNLLVRILANLSLHFFPPDFSPGFFPGFFPGLPGFFPRIFPPDFSPGFFPRIFSPDFSPDFFSIFS